MKKLSSLLVLCLLVFAVFGYYPDDPAEVIQGRWMRRVETKVVANLFKHDTLFYEIGLKDQDEIIHTPKFIRNFLSFVEYNEEGYSKESYLHTGEDSHIMSVTEWDDDMETMTLNYLRVIEHTEDTLNISIVSKDSLTLSYEGKSFGMRRY